MCLFSEYYFSAENLIYDVYLRKLMDTEGFVDLTEIAQFRRIVKLAPSAHLVSRSCTSYCFPLVRMVGCDLHYRFISCCSC